MLEVLGTSAAPVQITDPQPQLGQLLLERGLVSDDQLQYALAEQSRTGLPLGQVLISLSYVTAATIAQALATQQGGGVVQTEFGMSTGLGTPGLISMPPLSPVSAPVPASWIRPEPKAEAEPEQVVVAEPEPLGASMRIAELELEVASARQAEQLARQEEQLARQELSAARASGDELGAATARIAELESAHGEMTRQLTASMDRSEQLERELTDLRMGAAGELERTQHELALTTENLRAAYARLHEYETAAAFRQQQTQQQPRTVSPFAWQT